MSCTAAMPGDGGTAAAAPMVTLRVELPDGDRTITCESGDILRDVLLAEKVLVCMRGGRRFMVVQPQNFSLDFSHVSVKHSRSLPDGVHACLHARLLIDNAHAG